MLDTDGTMVSEDRDDAGKLAGVWIKGRTIVGDQAEVYLGIEVYRTMQAVLERPGGVVASVKVGR
jgi:hypothetical protein